MNTLVVVVLSVLASCSGSLVGSYGGYLGGNLLGLGYGGHGLGLGGSYGYGYAGLAPAVGYAGYGGYGGYGGYAGHAGYAGYGGYGYAKQYRAQDGYGNLNFGYATPTQARQEVGNAFGGVKGSYSYIDGDGKRQKVSYVADKLGFRVQATNLPVAPAVPATPALVAPTPVQDTPEVAAAKAEFQKAFDAASGKHKRSTPADTKPLDKDAHVVSLGYGYGGLGYGGLGYGGLGYGGLGYGGLGYRGLGYLW